MTKLQLTLFGNLLEYSGHVSKHPAYRVWATMIDRCHNPKRMNFQRYGGRGVRVCKAWRQSSRAFIAWAICNGYQPGLQIDRKNNNRGYNPRNCRFVTLRENQNNRRDTVRLSDGTPLADAIRASGLPQGTVYSRLQLGWSPDDAVSIPLVDRHKVFLSDGTALADAIRASGLSQGTVYSRLQFGWSPDDAVSIPRVDRHKVFLSDGTPLADAARAAGLSINTAKSRVVRGWSPDDAATIPKGGKRPAPVALAESEAVSQGDKAQRPAAASSRKRKAKGNGDA